jgi:hypothetical protein
MTLVGLFGAIFGVGCGLVKDITTCGAATWLSTIPEIDRAKVYYYTTTFKTGRGCRLFNCLFDYCLLTSALFLSR